MLIRLKNLIKNQYFVYHLRWQLSAFVMMPFMIGLESMGLPLWQNLMIGQFIGAVIFFKLDQYIFKEK